MIVWRHNIIDHIAQIKCFIFSFVCDKLKFVEITF